MKMSTGKIVLALTALVWAAGCAVGTGGTKTLAIIEVDTAFEACSPMKQGGEIGYAFTVDSPVDFDIHSHGHGASHDEMPVHHHGVKEGKGSTIVTSEGRYCLSWLNRGISPVYLSYQVDFNKQSAMKQGE